MCCVHVEASSAIARCSVRPVTDRMQMPASMAVQGTEGFCNGIDMLFSASLCSTWRLSAFKCGVQLLPLLIQTGSVQGTVGVQAE